MTGADARGYDSRDYSEEQLVGSVIDRESQNRKYLLMTTGSVERLIAGMALPSVLSILTTALYNTADTFFVSRIDTQATAAVGIVFPYMALIQSLAFFFGQGSAMYMARALGQKDVRSAAVVGAAGFFSALILGAAILAAGLLFMDPLLRLLGSTDTILPQARAYLRWILVGTPFIMASLVMNNQMRLQGNAATAMIGIISGAVLNIALDPLLIFTLGMGTEGASLATMLSQCVGFTLLLRMTARRDGIPPRLSNFRPTWSQYREIIASGLPSLGRQGLGSVSIACLNHAAGPYGDAAIAAFSVVNRLTMLSTSIVIGFGHGFQPVCGFNFGAGKFDRVRRAVRFCALATTGYCVLIAALGLAFAPAVVALFRPEAELVRIGAGALRFQCLAYPLVGCIVTANMYLQNIRRTASASVVAASRQGILFLPAILIGHRFFGLTGLMAAQAVADALTFALALPLMLHALNSMDRSDTQSLDID